MEKNKPNLEEGISSGKKRQDSLKNSNTFLKNVSAFACVPLRALIVNHYYPEIQGKRGRDKEKIK